MMSGTYAVTATVRERIGDGWTRSAQVPTFYLDADVQGIVDEDHAAIVARRVINPLGHDIAVSVTAVKVSDAYGCGRAVTF